MSIAAARIPSTFARNLVLRRHLLWNFIRRDLHARYVGSMGGLIWSLVHPLVLLLSYYFVFQLVLRIPLAGAGPGSHFAVFVFAAILPWLYLQDTLNRGCTSVVDSALLLRKTVFPSEVLPLTIACSNLLTHVLSLLLFVAVLAAFGMVSATALLIPLFLLPLAVFCIGLAWMLAALQVFVRDTSQLLAVGLVFWFWFTPIFYELERVPAALQPVVLWNPLTAVVQGYRTLILEGASPDLGPLLYLWVVAAVALAAGGAVFRTLKREFVDVL